ncbi:MAG: TraB/GumN family protein [Aquaticitalea sp.]
MKKLIYTVKTFLLSLAATFNLAAQDTQSSLLWKVEGNDIQTSYVFGTFHMLPKEDFILKDKVKDAFETSEQVVFELDMDDPNMVSEMTKSSMITDGTTLKSHMDDAEYELLDTYFKSKMGMGMEQLKTFKPLMLSSMIMMNYMGKESASYEGSLMKMAQEQSKEVLGLETVVFQMGMFDEQPYDEQVDDMIKLLNEPDYMKKMFTDMISIYKKENISDLFNYMDDYFDGDLELMQRLLDDRNTNWIPQIAEKSKDQQTFYAVGAGHLGGEKGVINLLKEAGYTVTPVLD